MHDLTEMPDATSESVRDDEASCVDFKLPISCHLYKHTTILLILGDDGFYYITGHLPVSGKLWYQVHDHYICIRSGQCRLLKIPLHLPLKQMCGS